MISYRCYIESDFEEVLNLLQNSMDYDTFDKELLEEKLYHDPGWNPSHTFIAEEDGFIYGFLQSVIRDVRDEKICYIKLLAVEKAYRRKGIASRLIKMTEDLSKTEHCTKVRFFDATLNFYMPGIDPKYTAAVCLAEKMGYKRIDEAVNMSVDLSYSEWGVEDEISTLHEKGIIISRANKEDTESLYLLLNEEWPLWKHEVSVAMKSKTPAVFIAKKENKVLAFSAYDGNNIGRGWFGPMGTHSGLRGLGIGGVLLKLCLKDIKEQGFKTCIIPWVGPVKFYSDYADAKISRIFWRYEKEVGHV